MTSKLSTASSSFARTTCCGNDRQNHHEHVMGATQKGGATAHTDRSNQSGHVMKQLQATADRIRFVLTKKQGLHLQIHSTYKEVGGATQRKRRYLLGGGRFHPKVSSLCTPKAPFRVGHPRKIVTSIPSASHFSLGHWHSALTPPPLPQTQQYIQNAHLHQIRRIDYHNPISSSP